MDLFKGLMLNKLQTLSTVINPLDMHQFMPKQRHYDVIWYRSLVWRLPLPCFVGFSLCTDGEIFKYLYCTFYIEDGPVDTPWRFLYCTKLQSKYYPEKWRM